MTRKQLPFFLALPVLMLGAMACACLGSGTGLSGFTATANAALTQAVATPAKAAATQAKATGAAANQPSVADGKAMGSTSATVTVQEFGDFQCPICREFATTTEPQLVQDYVKTGKVRFEYHHFIVIDSNTGGHESERAAEASECASAQGQFWRYHDTLFAHQAGEGSGAFSDARLTGFAKTLELDMTAFSKCFASSQSAAAVQADNNAGLKLGVQGTPTVFVNGVQVPDPFNYRGFKTMIDAALAHS